jgi:hypothetical protein
MVVLTRSVFDNGKVCLAVQPTPNDVGLNFLRHSMYIQVTVAASPPFGGTEIDHPRNTLPLAVKCLEGTKSWAHFQI